MAHDEDPVVVAVAPVAHEGKALPAGVRNPRAPVEVARETLRCWNAGAAMVHLHVRDESGAQVAELTGFRRTIDLIRAESDVIVQGSTGGLSSLSLEERCVCLDEPRVEMASLNMGSVNFADTVYINTIPDIRYWAGRMRERNIVPELEVFNPSMIETAYQLRDESVLSEPLHFNLALGFPSALSADPRHIPYLVSLMERGSRWGLLHEGMEDFRVLTAALGFGAHVLRVGFEDGAYIEPGRPAGSNAELVEHLVSLIRQSGREIASPAEARSILGLGQRTIVDYA